MAKFVRQMVFGYKNVFAIYGVSGYIMFKLINPFFHMMLFSMIATHVYGDENTTPWIIGNALVLCSFTAFFSVGQVFIRERWQGTLGLLMSAPTSTIQIVLPKVIVLIVDSVISIVVGFGVGMLFFDFRLEISMIGPFLLTIMIAILATFGLGLLVGAFGLLTRDIFLLLNLCSYLLIALTGVNFYVELLPKWLQMVSLLLPLTRSIEILRSIVSGASYETYSMAMMTEFGLGIAYLGAALILYKHIENKARKAATIDLY